MLIRKPADILPSEITGRLVREPPALPLRGHLSWREIDIPQTLMGQF